MQRRAGVCAVGVTAGVTMVLAGCSGAGGGSGGEVTWEDSPLEQVFSQLYEDEGSSPEDWEAEDRQRYQREQEILAECMSEQGFEYLPLSYGDSFSVSYSDEDWGSPEWVQQYGYGVTTQDEMHEESDFDEEDEFYDPNWEALEAMSDSERMAWEEAMWGAWDEVSEDDWIDDDEDAYFGDYDWQSSGCQGKAQYEVYESEYEDSVWEDPAMEELFLAIERIYEQTERDPKALEAHSDWSECLADAGFPEFSTPMEAEDSIWDEYQAIWDRADELIDWESVDWDDEDVQDPYGALIDGAEMAELREREVELAVADHSCREERNLESRLLSVQFEYEEEFLEEHQAQIDAMLAQYGQDS